MGDTLFQIIGGVLYCTSIVCTDVFFSYFKVNAELNMIEKKKVMLISNGLLTHHHNFNGLCKGFSTFSNLPCQQGRGR